MISITFDYPADVAEVARLLQGSLNLASQDSDNAARAALQKKRDATVTPIKAAANQLGKPAVAAAAAAKASTEDALDYERDVKPTALTLSRNPTLRPELIKIYKKFNVTVGSELKQDQLADALAEMKKVLGQ